RRPSSRSPGRIAKVSRQTSGASDHEPTGPCSLPMAMIRLLAAAAAAIALSAMAHTVIAQTPGRGNAAPAQAPSPPPGTAAGRAARDSIRDLGLQDQLPPDLPDPSLSWNIPIPPELVWVVLAVGLLLVLYAFRDMLPIWRLWSGRGWEAPGAA